MRCNDSSHPTAQRSHDGHICCGSASNTCGSKDTREILNDANEPDDHWVKTQPDLELGSTEVEHVVLSVQGMTCSGCEQPVFRSLAKLGSVRNVRIGFLTARAEFDLDLRRHSVAAVVQHINRTTQLKCERITDPDIGQVLDVVAKPEVSSKLGQK